MKLRIWLLRAILIGFLCAAYTEARKTPSRHRMTHKNKDDHKKNNRNTSSSKYSENYSLAQSYSKYISNLNTYGATNSFTDVSNNSNQSNQNSHIQPQNTQSVKTDNFIAGYVAGSAAARRSHRRRHRTTTTTTSTPLTTKSPCLSDGGTSNENQGEYCNNLEDLTSTTETSNAPIRRKLRRRKTTTSIPSTTNSPRLLNTEVQNKNQEREPYDGLGSEILMLSPEEPGSKNMNEDKAGVLLHNDINLF